MAAFGHDVLLVEEDALVQIRIEVRLHAGVAHIGRPAHKMVHAALRTVGVVNLEPVALRFYIVTDRLQGLRSLLGEQRSRGLVPVNALTHKVIRAKIADFQNYVRHHIRHGHKVIPADGKALELLPGLGKIGLEFRAGLQDRHPESGPYAGSVHVALPVGPGDDAAFTGLPGAGVNSVGRFWIDLRQNEGRRRGAHRMPGRIAAFSAEGIVLAGKRRFLKIFEGPNSQIEGLGRYAHLVHGAVSAHHHVPDGRRFLGR